MRVPCGEGVAIHADLESCAGVRKDGGEALTGESAGRVSSREMSAPWRESRVLRGADAVESSGRPGRVCRQRETHLDPARSKTPSMHGSTLRGNREIPRSPTAERVAGRIGKPQGERR